MLVGRLRERYKIKFGTTNKIIAFQRGGIEVPASGPAQSSGAGGTQDQGLRSSQYT